MLVTNSFGSLRLARATWAFRAVDHIRPPASLISVDLYSEAVERRSNAARKLPLELGVTGSMRKMCEIGSAGANFFGGGNRLGKTEVRWMGRAEERVQHQYANAMKCAQRFVRELLRVSDVAEVSDSVSVDGCGPVRNRHRQNIDITNPEAFARQHAVWASLRLAGSRQRFDRVVENVRESFRQPLHRFGRTVHVDRLIAPVGESADVVNAVNVVRVVVREENRIDVAYIRRNELESQLGWRVDQDAGAAIGLDERTDARPLVSRIRRSAHFALTSNLWNAKTGSRPQKGELQMVSTLSRLVVPGMSKGTPAVTMIRSPLLASSLSTTTVFVCSIISS